MGIFDFFKKYNRTNLSKCKKCNVEMVIGDYCSSCVPKIQQEGRLKKEEEILKLNDEILTTYKCLIENDFNDYTIMYKSLQFLFTSFQTINRFFQFEWGKETEEEFRTKIFTVIFPIHSYFLENEKRITLLINEERDYYLKEKRDFLEFSREFLMGRRGELWKSQYDGWGRFKDHIIQQNLEKEFSKNSDRENLHLLDEFNSLKYIFKNPKENIYNLIDNIISNTEKKLSGEEMLKNMEGWFDDSVLRVHSDDLEDIDGIYHYQGIPFTGIYYQLYPNGNLLFESEQVNGKDHGTSKKYKGDGTIHSIVNFSDGKVHEEDKEKNKEFEIYFLPEFLSQKETDVNSDSSEEVKKSKSNEEKSEKDNSTNSKSRVNFDEIDVEGGNTYKGVPFTGVVFRLYENGKLMWKGNYKDGLQIGWWKNYYESGSLKSEGNKERYKTWGTNDGLWKEYYENGKLMWEGNYKNGYKDKLWKEYYENSQLKSEGNYDFDMNGKQGVWKEYYENGQLYKEQTYDNWGGKDRVLKQYDKTGKVIEPEYELTISGIDNMSGYGNCDIKLSLNESQWEEYSGNDYYTSTPGGIIDLIEEIEYEKECVMVSRFQIFDKDKKKYYEISEIETFNTSKKNKELNKTYYRYGYVNYPNRVVFNLMNEEEIKEFEKEWEYDGDNRYFGIDVYSIENFDLELELKTDYLGGTITQEEEKDT